MPPQIRVANGLPVQHTSVSLDAVLFGDGKLVGPDQGGMFDRLTTQIKQEQQVAAILLNAVDREAAWAAIQSIASSQPELLQSVQRLAPPPRTIPFGPEWRRIFAEQLLRVLQAQGDGAAVKLAESIRSFPSIVRSE